jgi:hypothetical protein
MELESDALGVPGKVLKHELHSAKERREKKLKRILHTNCLSSDRQVFGLKQF